MANEGRLDALDALRGFALLGILVVNIQMFSGWGYLGAEGRASLAGSEWDDSIKVLLEMFAHDKFYSLFSLLFGYSFVMLAAKKSGGYHLRRMAGLLLFGIAHALLLWPWDILYLYAIMGVLLTPFLRAPARLMVPLAVALLAAVAAVRWYWLEQGSAGRWNGELMTALDQAVPRYANGGYGEVVAANRELARAVVFDRLDQIRPLRVLAMFLIGASAARLRLAVPDAGPRRTLIVLAFTVSPVAILFAWGEQQWMGDASPRLVQVTVEAFAAPLMAVAYASVLMLWWNHGGALARGVRTMLAPAGRMALTHYLGQSLVCVALFYGVGAGWFAQYSLIWLMVGAAALFIAQVLFSVLWLKRFRQGPMEALWRRMVGR
jgi:uncharacterized protein|tara:strand:- start:4009 stop:5139 length:1131 start_codon:yes stop_codon:yes gene_type:complete